MISWRNTGGPIKMEKVEVRPLEQDKSKVMVTMEYEPQETQMQQGDIETALMQHAVHQAQVASPGPDGSASQRGDKGMNGGQQPNAQPAAQQPSGGKAIDRQASGQQERDRQQSGRMSAPQQQGMQGAEQDPMLAAMASMNPRSWLPGMLRAWEEPFVMMRNMTEDMDEIFERFVGRPMYGSKPRQAAGAAPSMTWSPSLEIARRENQLVVRAELPGVKQGDVRVEIRNDRLMIEGDRREEQQREGPGYWHTEHSYGHFYRAIALPEGINSDQASASMRDGVLEVTVPVQQAKQQGRQLEIRSFR